jgi:GT2 family glycosyltransferase
VIPTFNREPFCVQAIQDLLVQDYSPLEIMVVDQSDAPSKVPALAAKHPDIISYHHREVPGITRARNFGWRQARFDTIAFIDDDVHCPPDFARQHIEAHAGGEAEVIAGGIDQDGLDANEEVGTFDERTADVTRGWSSHERQYVDHAPGANFSMSRAVLERVGGFNARLESGASLYEETEFCLEARRAGFRILFVPEARLEHLVAKTGGVRIGVRREYLYGSTHNRALMIRRHIAKRYWFHALKEASRRVWHGAKFRRSPLELVDGLRAMTTGFIDGGLARKCES